MAFSLNKILNEKSKIETNKFEIKMISVFKLVPSKDNFYSMEDIADLKDSVEMFGVQQNLTVRPIPNTDTYKLIAGHRRRLVSLMLTEEGKSEREFVPCRIEDNSDEIREKILLIHTNSTTRQLSDWEKVEQLSQMKELLKEYKKNHELPGRVRELLAEALHVSPSQVGRIEKINDSLIPELKSEMKENNLNFTAAAQIAKLPPEKQKEAFEKTKQKEPEKKAKAF